MATQPSSEKETVGISYAGAVLNLKNSMDSNKENIDKRESKEKPGAASRVKSPKREEYPQINSKHGRNKHIGKQLSSEHSSVKNKKETDVKEKPNEESEPSGKVKYVEAPLPQVNPWTKKNSSAHVIPSNNHVLATGAAVERNVDKRILQPQQQSASLGK